MLEPVTSTDKGRTCYKAPHVTLKGGPYWAYYTNDREDKPQLQPATVVPDPPIQTSTGSRVW